MHYIQKILPDLKAVRPRSKLFSNSLGQHILHRICNMQTTQPKILIDRNTTRSIKKSIFGVPLQQNVSRNLPIYNLSSTPVEHLLLIRSTILRRILIPSCLRKYLWIIQDLRKQVIRIHSKQIHIRPINLQAFHHRPQCLVPSFDISFLQTLVCLPCCCARSSG